MIVGIDFDTYKITLCALPHEAPETALMAQIRLRKDRESGDAHLWAALPGLFVGLRSSPTVMRILGGADIVFVERGFGGSRRSDYTLGAVFGALLATLPLLVPHGRPVNPISLQEWKKIVTKDAGIGLTAKGEGNGNAPKPVANAAVRALASEAWLVDVENWSEDVCDAYGIAYAGRSLNRTAVPVPA